MDSVFVIKGKVVKGKNRGKKMGFPTANIAISPTHPEGIYVSIIEIDGDLYSSVTFIGTVDTFNEKDYVAETYILNFNRDIYGKDVVINILKKLRDNKKFDSVDTLIRQIEKDKKNAEEYFRKLANSQ